VVGDDQSDKAVLVDVRRVVADAGAGGENECPLGADDAVARFDAPQAQVDDVVAVLGLLACLRTRPTVDRMR
jgi:hypothetical protein